MTSFADTEEEGNQQVLQPFDYALVITDAAFCAKPAPSSGGNDEGMHASDYCVLAFFVLSIGYFVGGMATNYQRTQIPRIPHAEFWNTLPSLVADGLYFTFACQWLKRSGGGGGGESYGALSGPKSENSYGAL
jgi:hypothetical protein